MDSTRAEGHQSTSSTAGRPSFDQALKRTLTRGHDGVLALVAPDLVWRGERSPELPAVARQADLVWEAEDGAGRRGRYPNRPSW